MSKISSSELGQHVPAGFVPPVEQIPSNDQILQATIPWEILRNATIIEDSELALIKKYDVNDKAVQDRLLKEHGKEFGALFLTLTRQINKADTLKYVLALIDSLLTDDNSRAQIFLCHENPFQPFARVLHGATSERFHNAKASRILAILLLGMPTAPEAVTRDLLVWCCEQLQQPAFLDQSVGLMCLQQLLRRENFRIGFAAEDGINKLAVLFASPKAQQNFQLLYQTMYCLWLLSYSETIAPKFHSTLAIPRMIDTIKQTQKEKVIRVGLATLKNLLNKGDNNIQMVECGLPRVLENLNMRKWGDDEMKLDMEELTDSMKKHLVELSSWEKYKAEVLSGNLEWSPCHKSEKFWRENVHKFEDNKFEMLGVLANLLRSSQNSMVLAVACFDIGEFIRFHPRGRAVVRSVGAKAHVMKLMSSEDAEVQKQALLCVQKLMVVNWEYLNRS